MGFFKSLFETNDEERCEQYRKQWIKSKEMSEKELTQLIKEKLNRDIGLFALLALYRKSSNLLMLVLIDNQISFNYALKNIKGFFALRFFKIGEGSEFEEMRQLVASLIPIMENEAERRN